MTDDPTVKPVARLRVESNAAAQLDNASARKGVQSVERAFEILQIVEAASRPVGVADIAQLLDSSSSKIHHYLVSLVRCGALRRTARGAYDLGPTALGLGLSALSRLDTVDRTCEMAEGLRDETGESVFVTTWGNRGPTIIRYFEGYHPLTVEARAGLVLPLLTSATGRVFLAWGNESQVLPLAKAEGGTEIQTIREQTRAAGLGWIDGDLLPRIAAVSAPVFSYGGGLTLAVTVLGWSGDIDYTPDAEIAGHLSAVCSALSDEFGGQKIAD